MVEVATKWGKEGWTKRAEVSTVKGASACGFFITGYAIEAQFACASQRVAKGRLDQCGARV